MSLDVPVPEATVPAAASCVTPVRDSWTTYADDDDQDSDDFDDDDYAHTKSDDDDTEFDEQAKVMTLPVTLTTRRRRIVEFCTDENSRIGRLAPPNCAVIRPTIADDLTTPAGLAHALAAVTLTLRHT